MPPGPSPHCSPLPMPNLLEPQALPLPLDFPPFLASTSFLFLSLWPGCTFHQSAKCFKSQLLKKKKCTVFTFERQYNVGVVVKAVYSGTRLLESGFQIQWQKPPEAWTTNLSVPLNLSVKQDGNSTYHMGSS